MPTKRTSKTTPPKSTEQENLKSSPMHEAADAPALSTEQVPAVRDRLDPERAREVAKRLSEKYKRVLEELAK
jgi:hypothetical protein